MTPLLSLAEDLAAGRTTSRALLDAALERIKDPDGEGARTFLHYDAAKARTMADAADSLRAAGIVLSPIAGLAISVKDLFDVAGEVTTAGSRVLAGAAPAARDAAAIARLRCAGAVLVGRTNMTEFAYSGVGLNAHYGTPRSVWDRATGRIPGGSSAGAAVSVADGMAAAAIGSDTGGSVRIPAALNGLAGFKPTVGRIPTEGCFPLSPSLDTIGPLAPTVACCAILDAVMAGAEPAVPPALPIDGLRLAVPQTYVLDGLDDQVGRRFAEALSRLSRAGARIAEIAFPELAEIPDAMPQGGVLGAEALWIHRERLAAAGDLYDPRVRVRIERARALSATDYLEAVGRRAMLIARAAAVTAPFDAVAMPTVPEIAPPLAALEASDEVYGAKNVLMLRNSTVGNFLGRCALTLPCHAPGDAPVGLMLMGEAGADRRLLAIGLAVERTLAG